MYKQQAKTTTPESPRGVQFFGHFPSNFLKPYGIAGPRPDEATIFRRVNPKNCEWLTRPKIAVSEFAATITNNMNFLKNSSSNLINSQIFSNMEQKLAPFLQSLDRLNSLSANTGTAADIKQIMMTILSNDDTTDSFFDEMIQLGGAMYLLGIHYAVVQTLLTNPEEMAQRSVGTTTEVAKLKSSATVPGVKEYLTSLCTTQSTTTTTVPVPFIRTKKNLSSLLVSDNDKSSSSSESEEDESEEDEPVEIVTPKATKQKKTQKDLPTNTSSSASISEKATDNTQEQLSAMNVKKRKHKKTKQTTPPENETSITITDTTPTAPPPKKKRTKSTPAVVIPEKENAATKKSKKNKKKNKK